jgi:DNA repair protein RAD16
MPLSSISVSRVHGSMIELQAEVFFQVNNVHVTVFLVSLKAGGVALNLTEASRVYLMDSWWNPAVSPLRSSFS